MDVNRDFSERLAAVYALYGKELTRPLLSIWWNALQGYDQAAVFDALNRHAVDPDRGQFLPRPADLVRLMQGSTQDAALVAWAAVERAIRLVGPYQSIVFDDPITHAVIADMGGWIKVCDVTEDELPFRAKEFENRYRGYRARGRIERYPQHLIGIAEGHNSAEGHHVEPPVMIGNPERCQLVYRGGADHAQPQFLPLPIEAALVELAFADVAQEAAA